MSSSNESEAPDSASLDFLRGTDLNRGIPLREQIYVLIRRAIVTGRLPPGALVSEIDIAERLGISRTPVREAVRKVSDEGLIEVLAQAGTYVAEISQHQVEEAYVIRIALELESVKRAAATMKQSYVHDLEDIVDAHEVALRRDRFDDAIARDDDFHRYIAEMNGLTTLWKVVDMSKAQMDRCRLLALPLPGYGSATIAQHREILRALETGDPKAAMKALKVHLDASLRNSLGILQRADVKR